MNWGHKIIAVYAVFVGGMVFLGYQSSRQNIELVTEDYYARELVYQQKIDEGKRVARLSSPVSVRFSNQVISIHFPEDFKAVQLAGELTLYCPANEQKDIRKQFAINEQLLELKVPANNTGLHYVKINWTAAGVKYYFEQKIII